MILCGSISKRRGHSTAGFPFSTSRRYQRIGTASSDAVSSFWNDVFCAVDESINIYPLGDRAVTVEWGRAPDPLVHARLISLHTHLCRHPFPGYVESVPAYVSLTIIYDPLDPILFARACGESVSEQVRREVLESLSVMESVPADRMPVTIPVCYDRHFGPDLSEVANMCGLSVDEVIDIHVSGVYRVYMIGFVPGFPYLGMMDPRLDVSRKSSPRMQVAPGSVAMAGRQTGIYPLTVPGGWQIIGRTPIRVFDPCESNPFLLKPGMDVRFERIDRALFEKLTIQ
jgi:inhibitor of KinA